MSIYVATVIAGDVVRVTVQPDDFAPGWSDVVIGPANLVGVGWTYADGQFYPPPPIEEEKEA